MERRLPGIRYMMKMITVRTRAARNGQSTFDHLHKICIDDYYARIETERSCAPT